jgi:hypothetical protein
MGKILKSATRQDTESIKGKTNFTSDEQDERDKTLKNGYG